MHVSRKSESSSGRAAERGQQAEAAEWVVRTITWHAYRKARMKGQGVKEFKSEMNNWSEEGNACLEMAQRCARRMAERCARRHL
jgi:hypothetical protein